MVIRIGINGFGRIGRIAFRTCMENSNFQIGAINDPALDVDYICYLIKFDSTHGKLKDHITCINKSSISWNGIPIMVHREKQPLLIPWANADVKYVIESSGMFTSLEKASGHLHSQCVKGVIVTAPSLDVPMIIIGVNEHMFNADTKIISCASSTLYCLAPIVKILEDNFGVKEGFVTTIHAMTPSLRPLDGLCIRGKHWRDHRSIHQNIIPAVTSACKALEKILPQVENKFSGLAFRVPIVNVSVLDITVRLAKNTTLKEIANSVNRMSRLTMKDIVNISKDKVVSSDFIGDKHSCTLDVDSSIQLKQDFFKLVCWYENEYSYACRITDLILHFEKVSKCTGTPLKTKSHEDFSKIKMYNEQLKRFGQAYETSILNTSCESIYRNTLHYTNTPKAFRKKALKGVGCSSILADKNGNARECLFLHKPKGHDTYNPIAYHCRNPFTQCCSKGTLQNIYKFNGHDETLADGEKGIVKIYSFEKPKECESNNLKISAICPKRALSNTDVDSLKTINVHIQENCKQVSVDDYRVESDAMRFRKSVSGDCERSTRPSDMKTNDTLDEESEKRIKLQKCDPQGLTKTAHIKQQLKGITNRRQNKTHKSEDLKTYAVKTINKVMDELSQRMAERLFSFNKKSTKCNKNYVKNGPKYDKYLQTDNIITEKEKIIINTNKNTKEIIKELQEKFANNKHQYLIYSTHKSKAKKNKHDHSNESCANQNTIRKDFKGDDTSVIDDNVNKKGYVVKSHDIDERFEDGLKLQRNPSETDNYFLQNETRSLPKIRINRNTKRSSDEKLNRQSSTLLTNNYQVNGNDVIKREYSVVSTNFCSNFETSKNDSTSFFEDVDSTSDMSKPEKCKMKLIHVNRFHETMKNDHESEPISTVSSINNAKSAFGDFNFYSGKEDLYDKLDSTSGTDSSNSFQMNEKKSQILQLSDLTNSLDNISRLDKICQIIEISDELSDKLFSPLKEEQCQNDGRKWSLKDLCEKLKLDDFCNSVFENIASEIL